MVYCAPKGRLFPTIMWKCPQIIYWLLIGGFILRSLRCKNNWVYQHVSCVSSECHCVCEKRTCSKSHAFSEAPFTQGLIKVHRGYTFFKKKKAAAKFIPEIWGKFWCSRFEVRYSCGHPLSTFLPVLGKYTLKMTKVILSILYGN